jgi:hypothetical protein
VIKKARGASKVAPLLAPQADHSRKRITLPRRLPTTVRAIPAMPRACPFNRLSPLQSCPDRCSWASGRSTLPSFRHRRALGFILAGPSLPGANFIPAYSSFLNPSSLFWRIQENEGNETDRYQAQSGDLRSRSGLPANDPKRYQYQLWIFDADRDERFPVDGGVFDIAPATADGDVIVPIRAKLPVGRPGLFALTRERPGGVVVSDRKEIACLAKVG